jgi:hypothetical protein
MTSRSSGFRFLTVSATSVATIFLTAMAATASGTGSGASHPGPVATYAPQAKSSTAPVRAASPQGPSQGPSNCVQKANDVHKSLHFGWMAGEVRATCRGFVPHMYHTSQLWQSRWWGGEQIGTRGTFDQAKVEVGSAYGFDTSCIVNWVWDTGNGSINDVDGVTYYAGTEGAHVYNPCRYTGGP